MRQKEKAAQKEPTFSKQQFLASGKFTGVEKDFLRSLLLDGEPYTIAQAKDLLKKTLSKEVK
jgi:hypothetical protein